MIRYRVTLVFEHKRPEELKGIHRKNQSLKPIKNKTLITYDVVSNSLKVALEKLKVRMKDTKDYRYIEWIGGNRRKT